MDSEKSQSVDDVWTQDHNDVMNEKLIQVNEDVKNVIPTTKPVNRYVTVEIPVSLTAMVFQMLNTLETEYLHDRIVAEYNYSQALNHSTSICNISTNGSTGSIEADIQSETSRWMFYLGLSYALPSKEE